MFVALAGTGATRSGMGKFLEEQNPKIRVIGADIEGSILSGGKPGAWKVEGIGEDFVRSTSNAQVIDQWIRVTDAESFPRQTCGQGRGNFVGWVQRNLPDRSVSLCGVMLSG